VALRGEIIVDPSGIPGVPEIMQQPIARGIEEFVCAMFPSSLRRVVDGVSQYLSASVPPSR
jgi:hypothetical protein